MHGHEELIVRGSISSSSSNSKSKSGSRQRRTPRCSSSRRSGRSERGEREANSRKWVVVEEPRLREANESCPRIAKERKRLKTRIHTRRERRMKRRETEKLWPDSANRYTSLSLFLSSSRTEAHENSILLSLKRATCYARMMHCASLPANASFVFRLMANLWLRFERGRGIFWERRVGEEAKARGKYVAAPPS
jgi:hypothetical protein